MPLSPHSIKRFAGLFGSTNPYGHVPEGAMLVADNLILRSQDVAEPRRGFKASSSCGAPVNALAFKQGVAVGITYDNPGSGVVGTLRKYDPAADAWTALPMNPGGLPIDRPGGSAGVDTRFVSAQRAIYFQSKYGLTKIEDIATGVCRPAVSALMPVRVGPNAFGLPDGLMIGFGGGTFGAWCLAGNSAAYRITICRIGANGELIESAPSDRASATNISGITSNADVTLLVPPLCSPDAFFRIYRSKQAAGTPSDEMFLVAEVKPAVSIQQPSGFLDFEGTFLFVDTTSDSALLVPLYTNAQTGGTIAVANYQAPLSVDMAWFRGRLYFLNTSGQQTIPVRVIGTGTGGILDRDYFVLAGQKFVFTENAAPVQGAKNPTATVETNLTVSNNIENTSRDIVLSINFNFETSPGMLFGPFAGGPLYSQITASAPTSVGASGADSGIVYIRSLMPGAVPFSFATNSANGWDRDYTAGLTSTANQQAAGLTWSNINEPEGVPLANNTLIGDPTAAGQRCIALKEALFIFKQDGLWKLTDDGSSIGPLIQPVDPTIRLVAPETAVALDNFILALCDQGVVLISETGAVVNITHRQIERELFALMARVGTATLANLAFGVAYPSEHTYILSLPESSNATACTRQYVYNLETQAWTSWTVPGVLCGAVNPDTGQLYFGRTDGTIWIERKNFDSTDYQDPGFTITSPATTITATMVFTGDLRTGITPILVGDVIQQFQATNCLQQRVIAVSYNSGLNQTTITLDNTPRTAWNNSVPLTVVKAIQCKPTFLPLHAGEPLQDKEWGDSYLSFRYCDLDFATVSWTSEKYQIPTGTNPVSERITNADGSVAPITLQGWGVSSWGGSVWGRQTKDVVLKCTLPEEVGGYSAQLTLGLTMPCGLARFELSAIDVKISGDTTQTTR